MGKTLPLIGHAWAAELTSVKTGSVMAFRTRPLFNHVSIGPQSRLHSVEQGDLSLGDLSKFIAVALWFFVILNCALICLLGRFRSQIRGILSSLASMLSVH